MSVWIYDLETYPNIFTMVAANVETKQIWMYEISDRKDDSRPLRRFLTDLYRNKDEMCGFNNIGFDYPLIHHFLKNKGITCDELYQKAMELINSYEDERFSNTIPEKDMFIPQLDLYKINHYDNKNKSTSLKMIEFNMRSKTIEDLPFPVGKVLSYPEMDVLLHYNKKDVMETYKFYLHNLEAIEMRRILSKEFNMACMNYNDTKLGKEYFINQLEKAQKGICYTQGKFGRKANRTVRKEIDLSNVFFDYVEFERPEFNAIKDWIVKQKITETKGVFSDIEENDLGDVAKYANMTTKKQKLKLVGGKPVGDPERKPLMKEINSMKKQDVIDTSTLIKLEDDLHGFPDEDQVNKLKTLHPCGQVVRYYLKTGKPTWEFQWKIVESLNVVIDGIDVVFGLGGLHASVEGVTFESNDEWVIVDYDVASYYPNLFISNRVYPEHLSELFCEIYKEVYIKRKSYAKGTPQNAAMKLALNGNYGETNNQYSPMYDPLATMTITINGQLSLCMLVEECLKFEGLKLIQCNTDGLSFYCKREHLDEISKVVEDWEKVTKLEMERALYSKMAIRDVNNYIAIYDNGKYKRNGAYEFKIAHRDGEGLQFHQNQSALIIREAAFEKIVNGTPVEETIKNCKDPYDFCLRTKVPRSSRLITISDSGEQTLQQNICRYIISNRGEKLVKIMPPLPDSEDRSEREFNIESDWYVSTCNNMDDFNWDINYDYYIFEACKLVDGVGEVWKVKERN